MEEDLVVALDRRAKEIADAAYIGVEWTLEYKAAREIERLTDLLLCIVADK